MGNYASDKKNARYFGLKLNRTKDKDLIELLEAQQNVQAFLKQTLRNTMKQQEKECSSDPAQN